MAKNGNLGRIIAGCKRAEHECFSELVDMYSGRCYGYFYRLTGDKDVSDDLLGELFIRLVEKINGYKGGSFDGWLFKTASNIFTDYLRAKLRQKRALDGRKEQLKAGTTKTERLDNEGIDKLQVQLEKLDEDTRNVILLRFYSQASFKEIAQMRSEPIGTTLSKAHRGLKRLRQLMD